MSKEKRDAVINCLKQGYTIAETSQKTGTSRSYVSKINRLIKKNKKLL
jgi:uncharacterized protein YerC